MSDDIFHDHSEMQAAQAAPEYKTSGRYREEFAAKFARSQAAGRIGSLGQRHAHGEGSTFHTRTAQMADEPQMYGSGNPMPGANPRWAEAANVNKQAFFDGPEAIARAMAAPQFDLDPSYRDAVREKIDRSIRERWIGDDFQARPVTDRFSRG